MYELISQAIIIDNSIFILMLSVNLSRSVASILFLRIVDREVKLDCMRRVAIKLVAQNYFTFGKGHTDEQDKAFIADFMAFAGKDSAMVKPMIDEYYQNY